MKQKLPKPRDDGDRQVLRDVAESGCHVIGVLASDGFPTFAYSIGLFHNYEHPEMLVCGLTHELMHRLINDMRDLIQQGSRFVAGSRSTDVFEGLACEFLAVEPSFYRELFGYARWFYGGDAFPAVQCVWPDRQGRFPWQSDYDPTFKPLQPTYSRHA